MNKIHLLLILSFFIFPRFLIVYAQQNETVLNDVSGELNSAKTSNLLEKVISEYKNRIILDMHDYRLIHILHIDSCQVKY